MRKVCPHREQRTLSPRAVTLPSGTLKRVWHFLQAMITGGADRGAGTRENTRGSPPAPRVGAPPPPCCTEPNRAAIQPELGGPCREALQRGMVGQKSRAHRSRRRHTIHD